MQYGVLGDLERSPAKDSTGSTGDWGSLNFSAIAVWEFRVESVGADPLGTLNRPDDRASTGDSAVRHFQRRASIAVVHRSSRA